MTDEEKGQIGAILEIVQQMQGNISTMQADISAIQGTMATKDDVAAVRSEMATKDGLKNFATKDDVAAVREDIEFIKENMVTKAEAEETESRLMGHIDGFARQNQKFDIELVAARSQFNRVEERVEVLELKAGIGA